MAPAGLSGYLTFPPRHTLMACRGAVSMPSNRAACRVVFYAFRAYLRAPHVRKWPPLLVVSCMDGGFSSGQADHGPEAWAV